LRRPEVRSFNGKVKNGFAERLQLFDDFFRKYEMKLSLDVGAKARNPVTDRTTVQLLEKFCRNPIQC
jgi:hypothetical protein